MEDATIRPARKADLSGLRLVELAASTRFNEEDLPAELRKQTVEAAELQDSLDQALVWVAEVETDLVGFLAATEEDGSLHILETSVLPAHGSQGLGSRLLELAVLESKNRNLLGVTLTTFSHVAWNGPAYAKAGFQQIAETNLTPGLRKRLAEEREQGFANRIAMRCSAT